MPIGPGRYDEQLTEALKNCGAEQGILIVMDGEKGPSFCVQMSLEIMKVIPPLLRSMADQIERDVKRV